MKCPRCAGIGEVTDPPPYVTRALDIEPARPPPPVVSTVRVDRGVAHDRVRVWNRGGLAGVLVVASGDGEVLAALLERAP